MKRYNTALSVRMDEREQGKYVKAEVAQALYDALKKVRNDINESDYWWMDCPDKGGFDVEAIDKALSLADGETE